MTYSTNRFDKFSTDRCPLCNHKLEMNVHEIHNLVEKNKIAFRYYCGKTEPVRTDDDMKAVARPHYEYRILDGGGMAIMIYPPYQLEHSRYHKTTKVYEVSSRTPKKLIFSTGTLDTDWQDAHAVTNKIRKLVVFS